ncbi:MAG: cyclomaltodextrinase N-terminal domain-containing protein [Ignavibacteria bacterium]|nr:cyclomaltodextrinase N-terminal domain-containing protein [Ignavibacteria bacterium]
MIKRKISNVSRIKHLATIILFVLFYFPISFPQDFSINKIEPPNWWTGMKWNKVQLMVYGENLDDVNVSTSYPGNNVINTHSAENKKYLFVDIEIPNDVPDGNYELIFRKENEIVRYNYPILNRELAPEDHNGFSNEDVIYLIFTDRFCDGNSNNNIIGDSLDEFTSTDLDGRHGGDIEGIISKLDYLSNLGVTALWMTPMLENNMWMSYHGYAATNLYKIDSRLGSNQLYKNLVDEAHKHGLKIILDHVSNHVGINHTWIKNLPFDDWFNGTPENHNPAIHDKMAFLDNYGDSTIVKYTTEGWFQDYMPDLNQRNPYLKKYLIQNTLWWIEYSGLDGIREDTYPYNDQKYLAEWAEAILIEYPKFNIVGEVWQGIPSIISGYQTNSPVRKIEYDSNLPAVTDFALADAIRAYLSGEKNIYQLYETLAQDIVYDNPDNLFVFMDNHDIERAMFLADGNIGKFKIALNLILFTRGIPVIFYGTEIGIKGGKSHGELRKQFPGGFIGDDSNGFIKEGRTQQENEIYDYLGELLKLRKDNPVLAKGKLKHIYLGDDIYVIVKTLGDEQMLIILNTWEKQIPISTQHFKTFLPHLTKLQNLKTKEVIDIMIGGVITLEKFTADIYKIE